MHIHVGRLVLKTRRRHIMWLPRKYKRPMTIYLVEAADDGDPLRSALSTTRLPRRHACIS